MTGNFIVSFHGHIIDVIAEYEVAVPAKLTDDPYTSHEGTGGWCEVIKASLGVLDVTDLLGEERLSELADKIMEEL